MLSLGSGGAVVWVAHVTGECAAPFRFVLTFSNSYININTIAGICIITLAFIYFSNIKKYIKL